MRSRDRTMPLDRKPSPPTKMPYSVRTVGRNRRVPYHATFGTYNDDAMLTLVVSGRGIYRTAREEQEVQEGMVGLVMPSPDVGLLMASPEDPYDHFYCRFAGSESMRTARRILSARGSTPFFLCPEWRDYMDTLERMVDMRSTIQLQPAERVLPIDALLAYLLSLMEGGSDKTVRALNATALRSYMRDHMASPASVSKMAEYFGMTTSHLCRMARQLLGDTIVKTWTRMKMEWASFFLEDPDCSVAEAAARAGYDDPFYFSRVFKTSFGSSPAEWRRRRDRSLT